MATKNISTYPVVDTIKDADKVVLSKDGTVRLVEIGTVKADMRKEIRDAKGEIQNELNSKTSATEAALDAESTARGNADTNLQTQIDNEVTAREKLENEDIPRWFTEESNHRINGDNNLQSNINSLDTRESNHYSSSMSRMDNLDSRVTANTSTLGAVTSSIGRINNLIKAIDGTGAGFHSSIYRGKYLGDTYTDEQKAAIANGTFDDLFVGDYWTINGVNWRIADFDYYYNIGSARFTKHHIVIVPDTILYNAQMNSEDITTGCYSGSEMFITNLDEARTMFDNAFGSLFIPTHKGLYSSSISGNIPSGFTWRDMRVELMNDIQVYGHSAWVQSGYGVGTQKTQFKLFMFDQTKINTKQTYWLESVRSSTNFVNVYAEGNMSNSSASHSFGVRPFACIVGDSE